MTLLFAQPAPDHAPTDLLLRHILEGAVLATPRQEIVYRDRHRFTYAEMAGRVHRLAGALEARGVRPGSTVAIMDWDSHRYLEAYFAVPMMGAVLQTANIRLSRAQLVHCLSSTGATHLIYHADFADLVGSLLPDLPVLKTLIVIADDTATEPGLASGDYEALLAAAPSDHVFSDFDENALATRFHTTGTTGLPKMVSFSHRQLVLHTLALSATLALQPKGQRFGRDDVYMPLTPMFHVHAWGLPLVATMTGVKQVYPGRYDPSMILDLKDWEGVTFSHCVPTVLQMILAEWTRRGARAGALAPWTLMIGGSALLPPLQRAARDAGVDLMTGYGMSETGPVVALARGGGLDDTRRLTDLRKAGRPLPLVRAAIVDADMNPQPFDGCTQGELVLRAPWLTASYPGNAEASADLWRGGWMHTQDIAAIGPDGTIEIRDRLKDVIKSGGEWISSIEIESLLLDHALVAEAAVVATPDPLWGERAAAFIVLGRGVDPDGAAPAIKDSLARAAEAGRISRFAIPTRMTIVENLPRTSVGKIDKKVLRQRVADTTRLT